MVGQVMRTIEVGSTAAAEAYLEAQQYRVADRARLARDLLEDLLDGRPPAVASALGALADGRHRGGRPAVVIVGR